jgi:hypothetical protein
MRIVIAAIVIVAAGDIASADDQAECRAGIEMVKSEMAKKPPQVTLTKLQSALRVAERELRESEFDECVDAVKDARKALGR